MKFYKCSYIGFIIFNTLASILKIIGIESLPLIILNYILLIVLLVTIGRGTELKHLYLLPISCIGMIFSFEYIPLIVGILLVCLMQGKGWKSKLSLSVGCVLVAAVMIASLYLSPTSNIRYDKQRYYSPDRKSYYIKGYRWMESDGGEFFEIYREIMPLTRRKIAQIHVASWAGVDSNWSGNDAIRANGKIIEINNLEKIKELDHIGYIANEYMAKLKYFLIRRIYWIY